jgi:hypothetical protein
MIQTYDIQLANGQSLFQLRSSTKQRSIADGKNNPSSSLHAPASSSSGASSSLLMSSISSSMSYGHTSEHEREFRNRAAAEGLRSCSHLDLLHLSLGASHLDKSVATVATEDKNRAGRADSVAQCLLICLSLQLVSASRFCRLGRAGRQVVSLPALPSLLSSLLLDVHGI